MAAKATPAAMEGRANGKAMVKKARSLLLPNALAASKLEPACSSNPALARR